MLVVGFEDGTLGFWKSADGAFLDRVRLHGPVANLLVAGKHLLAASELGDVREIDFTSVTLEYCDLLKRLWRKVPMVWRGGRPAPSKPDPWHRCRSR